MTSSHSLGMFMAGVPGHMVHLSLENMNLETVRGLGIIYLATLPASLFCRISK